MIIFSSISGMNICHFRYWTSIKYYIRFFVWSKIYLLKRLKLLLSFWNVHSCFIFTTYLLYLRSCLLWRIAKIHRFSWSGWQDCWRGCYLKRWWLLCQYNSLRIVYCLIWWYVWTWTSWLGRRGEIYISTSRWN